LEVYEKLLGPEHRLTLGAAYNLGHLYYEQGVLVEAEEMWQRALADYKKTLGPEHEMTLDTKENLELCVHGIEQISLPIGYVRFLQVEKGPGLVETGTLGTVGSPTRTQRRAKWTVKG
jgi:hypothetical protein